jgi:hypothetical protein
MDRDFSPDDGRESLSLRTDNPTLGRGGSDHADTTHARGARPQRSASSDFRSPRRRDEIPERSY